MFQYLKERFKEYMSLEGFSKPQDVIVPYKDQGTDKDLYIDYDIYYGGTTILIDSFSISKKEMAKNLSKALLTNLGEVLGVSIFNIRLVSANLDTIIADITYSGKEEESVRHELRKARPKPVYEFDPDDYQDPYDFSIRDTATYDPYEKTPWGDTPWYCMCCGFSTTPIERDSKHWDRALKAMKTDGTQWYLCTNAECFHYDSPLVLHHPYSTHTPAGDSYSLSRTE